MQVDWPVLWDLAIATLGGLAVGIERQWSGHAAGPQARFAGLRTFTLLGLIALFGVGILLSMSLFGVVLARVLSLRAIERLGHTAAVVVAVASIGLGLGWVLS